jgi:multidrug resistance efflux pump
VTRNRVLTALALVGLLGAGVTVLVAARSPTDKAADPARPAAPLKKLVCLGHVDTEDKMIGIFPDNYPQPSQVLKVLVREGQEVKKGAPLLELDRSMYELKVGEADYAIQAANDDVAKAQALVDTHKVELEYLEKVWKAKEATVEAKRKELEQIRKAVELTTGNKNRLDVEAAQAALTEAELNLDAAKVKWQGMKGLVPTYAVNLAQLGVQRAQNLKAQAERARDQVACTAKADGRIIRIFVSEGSLFGPATREPAFWFVKTGPLLVRAEVTQEFAGRATQGQTATIEDETDDKQRWTGRVTKVGDQFLPKRHSSGSAIDIFPVNDERVLECLVSIDEAPGKPAPRFGQKVRITLD